MGPALRTVWILLAFLALTGKAPARADAGLPPCAPPVRPQATPASIYEDEDPLPSVPALEPEHPDEGDSWRPGNESLSPFDSDDEDELQA